MVSSQPTWKLRDGDEKDAGEILSLRKRVFGEMEADKLDPRFWQWEFLDGPDGKALLYLAEDDGMLAGHFADIPRRFSVHGEVVRGTLSLDLMVHPDYRRRGIFAGMGQYAAQRVKEGKGLFMTAFPIRKETIAGLLKIGWEVVGDLPVLVFPLRFKGIIDRYLHFPPLSLLIGGVASAGYRLFWRQREGKESEGMRLDEVNALDGSFDRFWDKAKTLYPVIGVRDRRFLEWRFLENPTRRYTIFRVTENGEMAGYVVLRRVNLLRFNSAVMVDLLGLDERCVKMLVVKALEHSRETGADLLGCMIPRRHPYHRTLRGLGFLPSFKTFLFMVYRLAGERVPLAPEAWYVNWGDTDVI